jgi:deazaflavin-dependent oxidoreductase (nitroreductase family)
MPNDWNDKIIKEFRENDGVVGGPFAGMPMVLVHSTGAKTGEVRVNPLAYQRIDERTVAIFASKGGHPTHPDWYYNLVANPEVTVEIGAETFEVKAREAHGDERERIWEKQKKDLPGFGEYEEKTKGVRTIPVLILERQ